MSETIHLNAMKYPDVLHYEWHGERLLQTDEYIAVLCKPGRELIHHTKNNVFTIHNTSLEIFFFKEWCTVAIEFEQGQIVSYYCNVAMPSVLEENKLHFIDLDLDLVKEKNQAWTVVDEDEFEENLLKYKYPLELQEEARNALVRLQEKAKRAEFPFNETVLHTMGIEMHHSFST
ncbi:DUF402 domain-containing protein [Aureibacillus halotolerans]|uniref:DUF402 domain-containing protein n=1 Tax=Aureibacillus halotolerans TaxID=1508390 RepID=A0A4V3D4L3_9BACI|nr:DUF402 domain-containing protein [Aureibacillus halotolerans]TDQ36617.1 hypothetical protein EV213_11781 [Aureibacillus halotolerans]